MRILPAIPIAQASEDQDRHKYTHSSSTNIPAALAQIYPQVRNKYNLQLRHKSSRRAPRFCTKAPHQDSAPRLRTKTLHLPGTKDVQIFHVNNAGLPRGGLFPDLRGGHRCQHPGSQQGHRQLQGGPRRQDDGQLSAGKGRAGGRPEPSPPCRCPGTACLPSSWTSTFVCSRTHVDIHIIRTTLVTGGRIRIFEYSNIIRVYCIRMTPLLETWAEGSGTTF